MIADQTAPIGFFSHDGAVERRVKVLHVEDCPVTRVATQALLENLGVDLVEASDGAEGLLKFQQERFDLVLMDIEMPVMDGVSATAAMRELERRRGDGPARIAMLTASASLEHQRAAAAAGADAHLAKPADPDQLAELIREVAAKPASANAVSRAFRAPLTRRGLAKLRTRAKLLEAARGLFIDRGYEATTIRDIATQAGLSTGAVFASFTDKADLFEGVVNAERETLSWRLAAIDPDQGLIHHTLEAVMNMVHEIHIKEPGLLQAAISLSWRPEASGSRNLDCRQPVVARMAAILRRGVETGELSAAIDADVAAEMLWDSYLSNCQRVIFGDWTNEALRARQAMQIQMLLAGLRKAAA
ncbi:MAG: response regulator [Caulobacteraceae bacterium]|nr:response regulator [Caulobacteraceae bacterium]